MKNLIRYLLPSKLTYKLASLCIIAIFAGNAQANIIYSGPSFNAFGTSGTPTSPLSNIAFNVIAGPLLPNALNIFAQGTTPNYTMTGAISGVSFALNQTNDVGSAAFAFQTGPSSIQEWFAIATINVSGALITLASSNILSATSQIGTLFNTLTGLPPFLGHIDTIADATVPLQQLAAGGPVTELPIPLRGYVDPTGKVDPTQFIYSSVSEPNRSVPEPTSLLLLMTGMAGFAARRKKVTMATAA